MAMKTAMRCASMLTLALVFTGAQAADTSTTTTSTNPPHMTGKQKATAIGAGTGAVAGALVGGPVGAAAGAVVGGVVGHEGTDANGKVYGNDTRRKTSGGMHHHGMVRDAQAALNDKGYNAGPVDGVWGPSTESAVRRYQADKGLTQSGTLDGATLASLGVQR